MEKLLSVIIPSYNEEVMIERTASVITDILKREHIPHEILFVDDGSDDATWENICRENKKSASVRGISFSRNFGKDPAIFAGLSFARGACAAVIDCDLQHPPEKIVEMYRLWEDGYEIVEGIKTDRGKESVCHTLCAKVFYALIKRTSGIDMNSASDFKLLDRKAIDALCQFTEKDAFFRALSSLIGFRKARVFFEVGERTEGKTRWHIGALISYAVRNITSFSGAPMWVSGILGGFFMLFAVIGLICTAVTGCNVTTLFLAAILIALSCSMISISVLGYYVYKLYRQSINRPLYIISKKCE